MRCVLHVGPAKTGTSTIQMFLRENAGKMKERGIFVPPTRKVRPDEFFIITQIKYRPSKLMALWHIHSQEDLDKAKGELADQLHGWLDDAGCDTVILSHEGLAARTKKEITQLQSIIAQKCDEVTVVLSLRRQDLFLNSFYKNAVRNDGLARENFQNIGPSYEDMLNKLADVFGEKNVRPFVFPDSTDGAADLIPDFLSASGLPSDGWNMAAARPANETWDARAIDVLRQVNVELPPLTKGKVSPSRRRIENAIISSFPKREFAFHIGREKAVEVLTAHADGNRNVAQRWFGRDQLFNGDLSKYDREVRRAEPEDFVKIILRLAEIEAAEAE